MERVRNPDDRRSFLIHLTGEGQSTQRKAATALAGATDTLLRPLDPEERGLLRTLLTRIVDHWQALSAAQIAATTIPVYSGGSAQSWHGRRVRPSLLALAQLCVRKMPVLIPRLRRHGSGRALPSLPSVLATGTARYEPGLGRGYRTARPAW